MADSVFRIAVSDAAQVSRAPACHAEVVVENITFEVTYSFRQIAQGEAHVEHLVVEKGITHRHPIQLLLLGPMTLTQFATSRLELIPRAFALPVGFKRELQLSLLADAGKTKIMCNCYGELRLIQSVCRRVRSLRPNAKFQG